jgi:antitoxin ParD1/3/4
LDFAIVFSRNLGRSADAENNKQPLNSVRIGNYCQSIYNSLVTKGERASSMPTRNVNLTDHYDDFVNQLVTSGRFSNASEVMRAGLRLLEERAQEESEKLAVLRSLASEGFRELDQGQGIILDGQQQLAKFIGAIGRQAAEDVAQRAVGD